MTESSHTGRSDALKAYVERLRSAHRSLLRKYGAGSALFTLSALLLGFVVLSFLEHLFYLSASVKTSLLVLFALSTAGLGWYLMRQRHVLSFRGFYLDFCSRQNLPELRHALDLKLEERPESAGPLKEAAIRKNLEKISEKRLEQELSDYLGRSENHRYLSLSGMGAGAVAGLLVLAILLFGSASQRALHFWESYEQPNPYTYTVIPGEVTLEQGSEFHPAIVFHGERPRSVTLAFKTDIEESWRERPPAGPQTSDTTRFNAVNMASDGTYRILMDGFASEEYRAEVQLRPRFESLAVQVVPPSYTRLDSVLYSYPFSRVEAIHGSEIRVKGQTNKPQTSIVMHSTGEAGTETVQSADSRAFDHSFTLTRSDSLSFAITDVNGLDNKNRFAFVVEPVEDRRPFAEIVRPEEDLEMKQARPLNVSWEAGDDFGLRAATLDYELQRAFTRNPEEGSIPLQILREGGSGSMEWDIPALDPGARDLLTFRIRVLDNDPLNGPKEGLSRTVTIRFPSLTESMEELDRKEDDVSEALDRISESYEEMQQEYRRFREQLQENPETDWEQRQTLEEVEQRGEEVREQVEELNRQFEEIRREMQQNNTLSPESMKAYEELQELMREIDDPAFREAMEELQKAMESMSQEQLRDALENFEFNEQLYNERLKRTLELFKTLKLNSDLDKMANALRELSGQQEQLGERDGPPQEETQRQESIGEDLQKLREQLEQLGERAPERAREAVEELQRDAGADIDSTGRKIEEVLEQLSGNRADSAAVDSAASDFADSDSTASDSAASDSTVSDSTRSGQAPQERLNRQQQEIGQDLERLAESMSNARQQMNQQQSQVNRRALEYLLMSIINLSENQEELTRETQTLSSRSQGFVERARSESMIRDQFALLSDSLLKVSEQIPGFANAILKKRVEVEQFLDTSVEQLAERNKPMATSAQRESLGGINNLATMLAELLDRLQDAQSGAGGGSMTMQQFMEQMQEMSGQQQQLNRQIQEMINDLQGDRLSQDQMERLDQMARQQNRIREQIREMQRNGTLESGDEVLSELERMAEDMEQTINDLRGGQADRTMVQRQQNILSRMLQAEDAIQERDEKEEREGTAPETQQRSTPPEVTLEELQKRIRSLLNDPDKTRFKQDYQRLIQQYFELLKEKEL